MTGVWSVDDESLSKFAVAVSGSAASRAEFELRAAAEELARLPGFDTLITLDSNTIKELPHQIDVALRVLRPPMRGRVILADEVGLGKTIEAGIILKELVVRGLARRVLILTPAALVDQWRGELETKFFEEFETPKDASDWHQTSRGIASYNRAVRKEHQRAILQESWDLVILDEAHKVKNAASEAYKFIAKIQRNYILLLTATPLQNDLRELYNLVTLLRPGQLGTWREFSRSYLQRGDKRRAQNPHRLRSLISEVMIRTRRASVAHALELPKRVPRHPTVRLTPPERQLYSDTVTFLRELYAEGFVSQSRDEVEEDRRRRKKKTGKGMQSMEVIRLCQRLCSSSVALAESLTRLAEGELITPTFRARALTLAATSRSMRESAKREALSRVLDDHHDHVIVFSEHLPTLNLIKSRVETHGRQPIIYQGGLSREDRNRRLKAFKDSRNGVLIGTRAATEGLNLQFCNVLVNYELPWNPMVIEQRIGRIHRIGQTRDAHIINLAAEDTIESHILRLLDRKIKLFELVVGELDVILGEFGGAETLEERLADEFLRSGDDKQLDQAIERLGEEISRSREAGFEQERVTSEISGEDNALRLEREFAHLTIPMRVRLGYGTRLMQQTERIDARRDLLLVHVAEIMEALEEAHVEDSEMSREYGPVSNIYGVTRRGRAIHLKAQAHRLPMLLIEINADPITQ
jgi:SNF2 family DNA or RNA helicase